MKKICWIFVSIFIILSLVIIVEANLQVSGIDLPFHLQDSILESIDDIFKEMFETKSGLVSDQNGINGISTINAEGRLSDAIIMTPKPEFHPAIWEFLFHYTHFSPVISLPKSNPPTHAFEFVQKKEMPTLKIMLTISYISQNQPLYAPMGCEAASLLMALHYKGYTTADLKTIIDAMPHHDSNPEKGFVGSMYEIDHSKIQAINPAPLTAYANGYAGGRAANVSGLYLNSLKAELYQDNPVLLYVTSKYEDPVYRIFAVEGQEKPLLFNGHTVVLAGFEPVTDQYLIYDPNDTGYGDIYWIDSQVLEKSYNYLKWAVVVR